MRYLIPFLLAACDLSPEIATLPVGGARALIAVVIPEDGETTAFSIPIDEGVEEISIPFDRDDRGRFALLQLDCSLSALGLPVGPLPIASEGRPLPDGRPLEASFDGADVDAFEASQMLDLRLAVPPPPCPAVTERRRPVDAQIVFVEAGVQRTIAQLADGRLIDLESELLSGEVFLGALENGAETLLIRRDGTIATIGGEPIEEMPPPLAVRAARMAGSRDDLIAAADSGVLARFPGEPVMLGPLGSRLALARDDTGRVLFGSSALPDLIAWERGSAPVHEAAPAPITALTFRGETAFAGTSSGYIAIDGELRAQVSPNPILAIATYASGVAAIDEGGTVVAVSDAGDLCSLSAFDGLVGADAEASRMALALDSELVELQFSDGGLRCP